MLRKAFYLFMTWMTALERRNSKNEKTGKCTTPESLSYDWFLPIVLFMQHFVFLWRNLLPALPTRPRNGQQLSQSFWWFMLSLYLQ